MRISCAATRFDPLPTTAHERRLNALRCAVAPMVARRPISSTIASGNSRSATSRSWRYARRSASSSPSSAAIAYASRKHAATCE